MNMKELNSKLKSKSIVGFFKDDKISEHFENGLKSGGDEQSLPQGSLSVIENLISHKEALALIKSFDNADIEAIKTGDNGYKNSMVDNARVHSLRKTLFSDELAKILFDRIVFNGEPILHDGHMYKPVGVNPAFRFIKYVDDGFLVPHYDFPYVDGDRITLKTLVLNLTDTDAKTIFIKEYRENDLTDLDEMPSDDDIIVSFDSKVVNALMFDHQMLHAGTNSSNKMIIRTDIMYEKIDTI